MAHKISIQEMKTLIDSGKAIDTTAWSNTNVREEIHLVSFCEKDNGNIQGICVQGATTGKLYVHL